MWEQTFLGRKLSGRLWTCPKYLWLLRHGKSYIPNRTGLLLPKEILPSILRYASTRAAAIPAVGLGNEWRWWWWVKIRSRNTEGSSLIQWNSETSQLDGNNPLPTKHQYRQWFLKFTMAEHGRWVKRSAFWTCKIFSIWTAKKRRIQVWSSWDLWEVIYQLLVSAITLVASPGKNTDWTYYDSDQMSCSSSGMCTLTCRSSNVFFSTLILMRSNNTVPQSELKKKHGHTGFYTILSDHVRKKQPDDFPIPMT